MKTSLTHPFGLHLFDLSSPTITARLGELPAASARNGSVPGNTADLSEDSNQLPMLAVSDPARPVRVGGCDTAGDVQGVAVLGKHAFMADAWGGVQVIDIADPASQPQRFYRAVAP